MRRVFDKYDANKDGKISLAEYREALRGTCHDDVAAATRRMFETADKDGDGFIEFEEFVEVNAGVRMAEIKSAFRVFDVDGDGRISAEELAEVLRKIGGFGECDVVACRKMVKGVDKDGDGLIDMDEFVTMMTRM